MEPFCHPPLPHRSWRLTVSADAAQCLYGYRFRSPPVGSERMAFNEIFHLPGCSIQRVVLVLWGLCAVALPSGCAGLAKQEVRQFVDEERDRLDRAQSVLDNRDISVYLSEIAVPIIEAARRLDIKPESNFEPDKVLNIYDEFSVYVVHDPSPNAWVVGDDFACITTSAILFADHPEEIVFVLAHEFGHLRAEHQVQSVMRRQANEIIAGVAVGLSAGAAGMRAGYDQQYAASAQYQQDVRNAVVMGKQMIESFQPHKKRDEFESDRHAVELMAEAGFDLSRSADFLDRMHLYYGDEGDSDTHPPTRDRVERIRSLLLEYADHESKRHLDLAEFRHIQRTIQNETLEMAHDDRLTFYSVERAELAHGRALPSLFCCGPLDADEKRVIDVYADLVLGTPE